MAKSAQELLDDGFEEIIETARIPSKQKPKAAPKQAIAPYVVVDNSEQLAKMNESNELMRQALNAMVQKINDVNKRPKALDMKIVRNSSGFMDSVKVTLEY